MFLKIKHYLSTGYYFAKLAIQRQIEYPLFLISWFIMNLIQWVGGYFMLSVLVSQYHSIAGWELPELTFIFSLSIISHGLMVIFFIQSWNIGTMIIEGSFDNILLKPLNTFFLFIVRRINFIGIADLVPGIIIFAYGCNLLQFNFTFENIIKLLMAIVGATLIRTALFIIVGSVSFWYKNRDSVIWFVLELSQNCSRYPLTIYPKFLQIILTFIIPIGFISFYPAAEILNKNTEIIIRFPFSMITLIVGVLFFLLSYFVFSLGLKKYESVGN